MYVLFVCEYVTTCNLKVFFQIYFDQCNCIPSRPLFSLPLGGKKAKVRTCWDCAASFKANAIFISIDNYKLIYCRNNITVLSLTRLVLQTGQPEYFAENMTSYLRWVWELLILARASYARLCIELLVYWNIESRLQIGFGILFILL